MENIKKVSSPEDVQYCAEAILAFRENLQSHTLLEEVSDMMKDGFKLAYISNDDDNGAAAFVGYRSYNMLRTGKIIYIDDLFTFPEYRGRGYAGSLLDFIDLQAQQMGAESVHLDSGYALHPAHRLYLTKGFILPCHHFSKPTSPNS